MKPDPESQQYSPNVSLNPMVVKKDNHTLKNHAPPQKNKPTLAKALKQQTDKSYRDHWISDAAYYKAQARGFIPGYDVYDWLEAEQEYKEMQVGLFLAKCKEDGCMTVTGLRELAKEVGVSRTERIYSQIKLIHLIQAATGQRPCFRINPGEFCKDQAECQWSGECQKLIAEWSR